MRGQKIMKKYKNVIELIYDYVNKKINYDEYLKHLSGSLAQKKEELEN